MINNIITKIKINILFELKWRFFEIKKSLKNKMRVNNQDKSKIKWENVLNIGVNICSYKKNLTIEYDLTNIKFYF